MADKKIKVEIKFKQVIEYQLQTELSQEDYEELEGREYDDIINTEQAYDIIENYAYPNLEHIVDADLEFTDVQVIKLEN